MAEMQPDAQNCHMRKRNQILRQRRLQVIHGAGVLRIQGHDDTKGEPTLNPSPPIVSCAMGPPPHAVTAVLARTSISVVLHAWEHSKAAKKKITTRVAATGGAGIVCVGDGQAQEQSRRHGGVSMIRLIDCREIGKHSD